MGFELVEKSVLRIWKYPLVLGGLADHYYLATSKKGPDRLGWGPKGLELEGTVKVTAAELERVDKFIKAARYSISVHNCEHFANYVLHGLPQSSQMYLAFKQMGADVLAKLQPTQSVKQNRNAILAQLAAEVLQENHRRARIDKANQERIAFWRARGVEIEDPLKPGDRDG